MNHKKRLTKLEAKQPKSPIKFHVQDVEEITDEMRREQAEAYARGERYYIIDEDSDYDEP